MTAGTITDISYLHSISWLCLLVTLIILAGIICRYRYLFVKPSMVFAFFFHVQIQWPSTIYWHKIAGNLTEPGSYFILSQIFPLFLVAGSLYVARGISKDIFAQVISMSRPSSEEILWPIIPLFLVSLIIMGWYLSVLPWEQSGLHAVIFHPENAKMAREQSLKLLTDKYLKYAVSIFNSSLAPIIACLLGIKAMDFWRQQKYYQMGLVLLCLAPILVAVSLTGARGPSVMVLLAVLFSLLLLKGLPFKPVTIVLLLMAILVIPMIIELLRVGGGVNIEEIQNRYMVIIGRVAGYDMTVDAQWHVQYVAKHGFWGIAGIEKLAPLFGVQPVDILSIVGKYYTNQSETISANTSVIFLYYACFGWLAVPLCLLLAWSLDLVLFAYRHMTTIMLPVAIAVCGIAAVNLAHTAYTTIFVTHGFIIVLALCFFCDLGVVMIRSSKTFS